MSRGSYSRILAALFVLASIVCPGAASAWECEGRVCAVASIADGGCCCISPDGTRDAKCAASAASGDRAPAAAAGGGIGCADGCGCVQVITDCADHDGVKVPDAGAAPPFPLFAILPAAPVVAYDVPVRRAGVAFPVDTRGPPGARAASVLPHGLRAPPATDAASRLAL